jgi:hypothetical protein
MQVRVDTDLKNEAVEERPWDGSPVGVDLHVVILQAAL